MFRFLVLFFLIFQVTKSFGADLREGDKFLCTGLYEKLLNYKNDSTKITTLYFKDMNINQITINVLKNNLFEIITEHGISKMRFKRRHHFGDNYDYFTKKGNDMLVFSKETKDNLISFKKNGHFILFTYPSFPPNYLANPIISIYKHKCIKVRKN